MFKVRCKMNKLGNALLVSVSLILILAVVVFAFLRISTGKLDNIFVDEAPQKPVISESFDKAVKSNVKVQVPDHPDGVGYSMYVRALIVVTWYNETSNTTLHTAPVLGTDYSLDLDLSNGWLKSTTDGFYYYTSPVKSGEYTNTLINSCKPLLTSPEEDYALRVEIISQTVQASGKTSLGVPAVTDVWGVGVKSDGTLDVPQ